MTIVFFSNILNHHQVSLCDELFALCGDEFTFVELSSQLNEERRKMGFTVYDRNYKFSGIANPQKARKLAIEADIAIMGAESYNSLKTRLKYNPTGITFSYSERWLKKGLKNILSPAIIRQILLYAVYGWRRKWYMLCASGYLAKDLNKLRMFKHRCYQWGYFPKYSATGITDKNHDLTKILWVARFINWKHPEAMLALGEHLNERGYSFCITMIGDGPEKEKVVSKLATDPTLSERITLTGNIPNEAVIEAMRDSDIFCLTSDRQEGWGAVLGEAMAAGCCPIASSDAGATPLLIKNELNGVIYTSGNIEDFTDKVRYLIDNPTKRTRMGKMAQKTMLQKWSPEIAAKNLVALATAKFISTSDPSLTDEPCTPIV